MAELSRSGRARTPSVLLAASLMVLASTFVGVSLQAPDGTVDAAPLSLTFEPVSNTRVSLGALASRTQCGPLTREGQGPYTMRGTDSSTGQPYSYSTDSLYNPGAQQRESREAATTISYSSGTNESVLGRTGVLRLASNGNISFTNTCSFGGSNVTVYGSAFGPQVYTQAFQATAGQALSFDWAAQGGGDDYEVYGFLVRVANSSDYGSAATTTVLAYGRGRTQGWTTSTGLIPADGWYRFRFVNGSYDKSGGYLLGATMYVDPRVLVGEANNITFGTLTDRITSGTNQTFTISATTASNGVVNFTSTTTGRCTVGSSTLSGGVSTATVTLLANQTGLCTIAADSASTGEYATAATVTRSFNLLAAPTAPTNSGGTTVSGTAAIGQTMTAVDGSWADGGSAILSTTYQWQSCLATSCSYTDIAGAVDSTIVLGSSDVGRKVRVKVTKTNSIGSTTVISGESATIAKGNQSALTISSTTATYGQVLTLTTSGGSGTGAVTYSKVSGTCTLSGDQLTPGDAGSSCVLTATKAGDAAFNPVTSASTTIVVNRAAQAPVTVTSTSGTFGTTLALTATGGSGTGAISWRVVSGACTLVGSSLAATAAGNTCQVAATRAADTNHLAEESAATTVAFARASQSNAVVVTPMSLTYGQTQTLAATGGSGTGAIEFTRVSGPCTVSGTSVTSTNLGTCVVTATKLGDSNYFDASSSPASLAIGVRTLTVQVTANNKPYDGGTSATLSLGALSGIVNGDDVSLNPSRVTGTFFDDEVGQNKLVILSVLSNALQGADASKYTLATPTNPRADIVRAGQSALTFMNASQMTVGGSLTLDATGGQSTGGVTYSVPSGDCAIANGVLTATKGGITCVVTATRAGDSRYNPVSTTQTVTINKITQVLRFQNTAPSSAVVGGTWTATVTSDAFLAATLAVANSSSSVCSLSADVVTFLAPGTCLVSASQAGTDTYAPAAISQSINVTAAPPPPAPAGSTTGSTVPGNSPTGQTPVTTVAPSTTTTTTTTIPNQGDPSRPMTDASGALPDLEVGTTTALVRGQRVLAEVITNQNDVTIVLPNEVSVVVGATDGSGAPLPVDADGAIRVFDDNLIRVTISGLIPGTTYTAYLFSEPVEIGRGVANGAGQVDGEFSIPAELEAGSHTLQVNGVGPNSEVVSVALGIAVMEKTDNTRIVLGLIGAAILVAMFIPLGFRRRAHQAF